MSWVTLQRIVEDVNRDASFAGQTWIAANFVGRIVGLYYVG